MTLGAVVIGRNEGARLLRCLTSLEGCAAPVVYVDSGSTDGSVAAAEATGADVVALDMSRPFTAARARNEGMARLRQISDVPFVQVVDGDCELQPGWTETAVAFLKAHPDVAVVAGRLRERFPEATIWNQMANEEWNTPIGETDAVGGIAVLRLDAVKEVDGYRDSLIAGEEPEMCLRLRRAGWRIWRLDAEMALHDLAMTRFSQWWRRAIRYGYAIAQGAALHGQGPERYCRDEIRQSLMWGLGVPLAAMLGSVLHPLAWMLLLAWPIQVLRRRRRGESWADSFFLTLGKLPETVGILKFHLSRLLGRGPKIIEYK